MAHTYPYCHQRNIQQTITTARDGTRKVLSAILASLWMYISDGLVVYMMPECLLIQCYTGRDRMVNCCLIGQSPLGIKMFH